MEFTVIDANVIRASCAITDRSKPLADKENDDELIAKFEDINKLDLGSFSKCVLHAGHIVHESFIFSNNEKMSFSRKSTLYSL